jgi:hypothetical protein
MLPLPDITICCIDTRYPHLGLNALENSMRHIKFGDSLFITTGNNPVSLGELSSIRMVTIEPITSVEEYSSYVLTSLLSQIRTPYVLLIQWDGYVIHPQAWSDEFLSYDYIGATWLQKDGSKIVGNGGFSLRSRKLLEALSAQEIQLHHPEDDCISKTNRALLEGRYNIRFADPDTADRFAFEFTVTKAPTFGFHGFCNFPDVMSSQELKEFVSTMPDNFVFNGYFPMFLERLQNKLQSDPLYGEIFSFVQQTISTVFAKAGVCGQLPEKQLIKALLRCNLVTLAKAGLKLRIAASGYSSTNLRLLARYGGGKIGLRL